MKSQGDTKPDPNFLRQGFFEMRGGRLVVRADLIAEHARLYGEYFASEGEGYVSSTQLRDFYGNVKALERRIEQGGKGAFDESYHLVKMLKSRASYIRGKKSGGQVSEAFERYVHTCIDAVDTQKHFNAFLKFFESTVGFYYGHAAKVEEEKKKQREQQQSERRRR